jgi:hypothetical protein
MIERILFFILFVIVWILGPTNIGGGSEPATGSAKCRADAGIWSMFAASADPVHKLLAANAADIVPMPTVADEALALGAGSASSIHFVGPDYKLPRDAKVYRQFGSPSIDDYFKNMPRSQDKNVIIDESFVDVLGLRRAVENRLAEMIKK